MTQGSIPDSARSSITAKSMWMLAFILIAIAFVGRASAQISEGAIVGTVSDVNGGRIAGATIAVSGPDGLRRTLSTGSSGEFRVESLQPGLYNLKVSANGFGGAELSVSVAVSAAPSVSVILRPGQVSESIQVKSPVESLASQPIETTGGVEKTVINHQDLVDLPLAHRSFANIAYLAPMTEPVEPSDPTKARITAVSFAGSSGLNVDLSVDGGDNNDDYIGGFLQNYSPDAVSQFTVRTAQYDADTSRTNGGSVIITTRRGTDEWHGDGGLYIRTTALNARNTLDNPDPAPKQPFSRQNGVFDLGGPLSRGKFWIFGSLEYVRENASVAYSQASLNQFQALARLASQGLIPGVTSIDVPASVPVPFRDTLFTTRFDWLQSQRSSWFLRGSLDRNKTDNDLVQQGTLPSTGSLTRSNYYSVLLNNAYQFSDKWLGNLIVQANGFDHTKVRNSNLGLALAFPFSTTTITTSGFETFGDNQFVTAITAFPIQRDQQKYQIRYDVARAGGVHSTKFGVNFIHEPVFGGALASSAETLVQFLHDPTFYIANPGQFARDFAVGSTFTPAGDGGFAQNVQRLGLYAQDSWRITPNFTINYGLRYDTTFGLFQAEGRNQNQNPAVATVSALGLPLTPGIPHDYRKAFAPRLNVAYAPGRSDKTVVRAGIGLYYNDLTQNGWVDAFTSVNHSFNGTLLGPGDQGAVIDPNYKTPNALQASFGVEHRFNEDWLVDIQYEHQQGVHQYRRYEYVGGVTLPANAPNISVFRTDNRSRYDGVAFQVQHRLSNRFELSASYTLASATTWGATVGELFDYVNGVTNVLDAFGPGDHGPSGEDVRHRVVIAGTLDLPHGFQLATLSQFESARPFTLTTLVDVNGDGLNTNDRAVVNGVQTSLDQFRGTPFYQVDLRVSRDFRFGERVNVKAFVEFFNLFNRQNAGNNYVPNVSALPFVPPDELSNVTHLCANADCTSLVPITSPNQLKQPAGALGDFFGPGTTVGLPFAAQIGFRVHF